MTMESLPHSPAATGSAQVAEDASGSTREATLISLMFFGSGIPALIYQLVWQRMLAEIFGVQIEAVTVIVTAFMIGLGCGSLAGGWLSTRTGLATLRVFALIELSIAALGAVSLPVLAWVSDRVLGASLLTTALVTLALVIVPTMLMGATLPLLVRHWVSRSGSTGESVGRLYCMNTLGAAFACVLAAFVIFPLSGMRTATYLAALLNATVAIAALTTYIRSRASASRIAWASRTPAAAGFASASASASTMVAAPLAVKFRACLWLAALGGGVSMSFEVFLFRTISFSSGGSASAFATTLAMFLAGLAMGAQAAGRWCGGSAVSLPRHVLNTQLAGIAVSAAFLPIAKLLSAFGPAALFPFLYLAVFVIATAWGTLLPLLSQLSIAPDHRSGLRTSQLYLANIVGSASGSLFTGFVAMQSFGLVHISIGLTLASAATLGLFAWMLPGAHHNLRRRYTATALALALCAALVVPAMTSNLFGSLEYKNAPATSPVVDVLENRHGIVTVAADGSVYGGGMYDGKFNVDPIHDTNMVFRPYGLAAATPAPRRVLMIGLSSGSWAQVLVNMPGVESLTVVELNDGYATLIGRHPNVASLLRNPKVTLITDDGRRWVRQYHEPPFDMIVMNTTFFMRAQTSLLLSREMVTLLRDRLVPGGLLMYNTTESKRVQRTGCEVFGNGVLLGNNIVLSTSPIIWDVARWRRAMLAWRIDGKPVIDPGNPAHQDFLRRFAQHFPGPDIATADTGTPSPMPSCQTILAQTQGFAPVTDDNMGSEWRFRYGVE
ncbi:fused MFS/spermidine synthase [Pandoraea bronchicola]|uniref:Polyamine aminopropyltransferase n=1 Tax=Pandoraea bronchicola TaxID=2508287 RepID=A0A5E5BZ86_9BURK|nr:fused MFS/spermidine synthase [Pandoraea bronchicola]VVE90646.1 Polyamine aminopropyltransferase [Pandoraea bronchicola]